jgi:Protein of unknown function (DUF4012)
VSRSLSTSTDTLRAPAGRSPVRARVRVKRRHRRWWQRPRVVVTVAAIGLFLAALALDAAYVASTAPRELRSARDALQAGGDSLQAGHLQEARLRFTVARDAIERADDALGQPVVGLVSLIPGVGDDVDAVRSLAGASDRAASAGLDLVDAAQAIGWTGDELPSFANGVVRIVDGLQKAAPELDAAARALERASSELGAIDTGQLFGGVRSVVVQAREAVGAKVGLARTAATLGRLVPGFLGADGRRTYLVITENLSEMRGSGGFPGDYATLTADRGHLHLSDFQDISTLDDVRPIRMPNDYVRRYAALDGLTKPLASNFSPDFPTSALAISRMWAASGHRPVDGVIAVDPVWMSDVLHAMGPVDTRAWSEPITADNVTTIMSRDTFRTNDWDVSNQMQSAIGAALWNGILRQVVPPQPMAEAMALAARERHLQVYSIHPDEEAALEQLGAAGVASFTPDSVAVSWFGPADTRLGFFARKSVDYSVHLQDDGSARVTVTTTLENPAPDAPISILLGRGDNEPVGTTVMSANLYLPEGAKVLGGSGRPQVELGHPVVALPFVVASGRTASSVVRYTVAHAVVDGRFGMRLVALPALRPDQVSVEIAVAEGMSLRPVSSSLAADGSALTFDGAPTTSVDLTAAVGRG